jgi:hypothetical protein
MYSRAFLHPRHMKPKSATSDELRLRARIAAPLIMLSIAIGAAILATSSPIPLPLPRTVSLALAADKSVGEAQTLNQPFAFFVTNDAHRKNRGFTLVMPRDRKTPENIFISAIQEDIARNQPQRVQKLLPDNTLATELVADPALFPPRPLPNGAVYWRTDAGSIFLISENDSYTLTNDSAVLINPAARHALQRFIQARPKTCRVYLQAAVKELFPPKEPPTPIPTMNRLIERSAEYMKRESYSCFIWG